MKSGSVLSAHEFWFTDSKLRLFKVCLAVTDKLLSADVNVHASASAGICEQRGSSVVSCLISDGKLCFISTSSSPPKSSSL